MPTNTFATTAFAVIHAGVDQYSQIAQGMNLNPTGHATIILATNLFLVQGQEYIKFFKVSSPSITQKVKLGAFVKIILNCEKNDSLAKYDYIRGYLTKIHNDTLVIKYNIRLLMKKDISIG